MIVTGCKSYAHKQSDCKEVIKQKGIALDYSNSVLLTLDSFKSLVTENKIITSHPRFRLT